jgi:nuclear receptor co-repressor 1
MDLTIPLYQEANDLESIRRIRTQYMNIMKNRLKDFFKKKHERTINRIKIQSNEYDKKYQEWQKSIEKDEKMILNKDLTTYREIFEKTFPELRKTREDKEKKQSDSSTTEQQISLNPNTIEQELEVEEEKMRKSSVVPPILYNRWQRKHQYFNQNGLIKRDAAEFYKERTKMPYWSPEEKQIFIEKFTQSPKNFGYISSFLENKTTEQCVQFYYMTKKSENYKNLLRKQGQANRRKAKQTTTTTVTSSTTIETTLVTKVTSSNTIVSSTSQQMLGQVCLRKLIFENFILHFRMQNVQ